METYAENRRMLPTTREDWEYQVHYHKDKKEWAEAGSLLRFGAYERDWAGDQIQSLREAADLLAKGGQYDGVLEVEMILLHKLPYPSADWSEIYERLQRGFRKNDDYDGLDDLRLIAQARGANVENPEVIAAQEELPTLALHRQGGQYLVFANRMAWLTVISGMLTLVAGGLGLTLVPDIASYAAFGAVLPLFFGFLATRRLRRPLRVRKLTRVGAEMTGETEA